MYEAAIANYNKALELYPDAQEPFKRINLLTKRKQNKQSDRNQINLDYA